MLDQLKAAHIYRRGCIAYFNDIRLNGFCLDNMNCVACDRSAYYSIGQHVLCSRCVYKWDEGVNALIIEPSSIKNVVTSARKALRIILCLDHVIVNTFTAECTICLNLTSTYQLKRKSAPAWRYINAHICDACYQNECTASRCITSTAMLLISATQCLPYDIRNTIGVMFICDI